MTQSEQLSSLKARSLVLLSFAASSQNRMLTRCHVQLHMAPDSSLNHIFRAISGQREECDFFPLGDFVLTEGATLRSAKLAYKTWGTLSGDKSNAIVYPSWYSGKHWDNDWLIGPGMGLDPQNVRGNKYMHMCVHVHGWTRVHQLLRTRFSKFSSR